MATAAEVVVERAVVAAEDFEAEAAESAAVSVEAGAFREAAVSEAVASAASESSKRGAYTEILSKWAADVSGPGAVLDLDRIRAFLEVAETVGASGEALTALHNLVVCLSSTAGDEKHKWSTERMARYFAETKLPRNRTHSIGDIARLLKPRNS